MYIYKLGIILYWCSYLINIILDMDDFEMLLKKISYLSFQLTGNKNPPL